MLSLNLRIFNKNKKPFFISELNGLGISNPLLAFTLTIIIFSIAGTPPLAGFIAKLNIFFATIESSFYILRFLGIIKKQSLIKRW
jgi:NADH:ubiquinone oxidoreductase subunit 2 (subunit N)